ncbi:MAG: hypothetical protein RIR39_967 [Pseudomonadota bacterium]
MLFTTTNIVIRNNEALGNLSAQSKKLSLKYHLLTTLKIYLSKTGLLPDMITDMDGASATWGSD